MSGLLGSILRRKLKTYGSPNITSSHTFGFLIDETDPVISSYLEELERHPFFRSDSKKLSFRKKETPHKYEYSYLKEELPFTKWPIQKEVENFIEHRYTYFFPLIRNWKNHHEVICRLVNADIKFAEAHGQEYINWNICINKEMENPIEFLTFAKTFISNI